MKQISLDDLVSLPDKDQQELDRLLAAYRRRLTELADYAKAVRAQAQNQTNTSPASNGNPDQTSP